MPVRYVDEFTFAPSPDRPTIKGYARGGHVKASTPKPYASGGTVNPADAKSPGSFVRSPPKTGNMMSAAKSKFAAKTAKPATKQVGNVQRMADWSDFSKGGSAKPAFDRIKNLGHYAHGGKVKPTRTEKGSGTASASKVGKEVKSGTVKKANGGLTRGTSPRKNAAIHAKMHRPKMGGVGMAPSPMVPGGGAIGALAGLSGGQGPGSMPPPGVPMGGAPGAPPAMRRGGRA